jgi:hypothetical protein
MDSRTHNPAAEFPRGAIAIALMIGAPACVFAAIFTALAVDYSIGSYRVLPFGNRVTDVAVAAALAVAFGTVGVVSLLRLRTEVRTWRKLESARDRLSADRVTSLILATVIVAVAMAGGTWLQDYRQFPWIVFMGAILPAELIIVIAAGGPHEASGESYVWVATFFLATMMWYGLIEAARRWWPRRTKRDQSSNA